MRRAGTGRGQVGWVLVLALLGTIARAADPGHHDEHSFGNPEQVRVEHLDLVLSVNFDARELTGTATWTIVRPPDCPPATALILDTRDLSIKNVENSEDGSAFHKARYHLGDGDAIRGQPLEIALEPATKAVRIRYRTSPRATALQWVEPPGTAGKRFPFLYSQSESIHARSWIPCQDSPSVRVTYHATVHLPEGTKLRAVMSADLQPGVGAGALDSPPGRFSFVMDQPIPSYLIALAVGDLQERALGPRSRVLAEPALIDRAAAEFADTEAMITAAEKRFGPYRWGHYGILVLPPSFPLGGMENAKLTFATPTVLAGDKSMVSLIAHELSHSWAGNLVTCASWRDFWLNEGVTTYLERRITEDLYGSERADMEWVQGKQELDAELARYAPRDQVLAIDLAGRGPDEGAPSVPYEKGALFLKRLEKAFGRERFDPFLRRYFDHFAFRSLSTEDFEDYLKAELFPADPEAAKTIDLAAWLHAPGLPSDAPVPTSARLAAVVKSARCWREGAVPAAELPAVDWSTMEWVAFLRSLPHDLAASRLGELDAAFHLTDHANAAVCAGWLELAIRAKYAPANTRLETYLTTVGRRRYIVPLYEALARTKAGKKKARTLYEKARPGYHPMVVEAVDRILGTP